MEFKIRQSVAELEVAEGIKKTVVVSTQKFWGSEKLFKETKSSFSKTKKSNMKKKSLVPLI